MTIVGVISIWFVYIDYWVPLPWNPHGPVWCAAWDHCISCHTPDTASSASRARWSDVSLGLSWGNNCSHTLHTCSSSTENISQTCVGGPDLTWACCWLMWCLRLVNSLKQWGHLASFSSLDLVLTVLLFFVGGGGGSWSSSSSLSCSPSSSWLQRGSSTVSSAVSAANIATGLTDS